MQATPFMWNRFFEFAPARRTELSDRLIKRDPALRDEIHVLMMAANAHFERYAGSKGPLELLPYGFLAVEVGNWGADIAKTGGSDAQVFSSISVDTYLQGFDTFADILCRRHLARQLADEIPSLDIYPSVQTFLIDGIMGYVRGPKPEPEKARVIIADHPILLTIADPLLIQELSRI